MNINQYLSQPFAIHGIVAAILVAIACGLIAPFVMMRGLAFAVHGTSELAFTGAAAGLLTAQNPILGAYVGAVIVATLIGVFGNKEKERDSTIGVTLAFGLGVGVLLLSYYKGFASSATNILFGNIFGVTNWQIWLLGAITLLVILIMALIQRPLLFASVDPEVARAKGIKVKVLNFLFLYLLSLTVTSAAQVVGTLLVLSLTVTPAIAARKISAKPVTVTIYSIIFALISSVGGIFASLESGNIRPSILVSGISFLIFLICNALHSKQY